MEYRILDYEIKNKGRISDALGVIFGLGKVRRSYILDLFGFGNKANIKFLNYYLKDCLRIFITSYTYILGSPLRLNIKRNIEFYVNVWAYRGLRFKAGLPMRGQNTRSNAKSIKYTVNFFQLNKW